jgi:AcrR family transcriptional regulator
MRLLQYEDSKVKEGDTMKRSNDAAFDDTASTHAVPTHAVAMLPNRSADTTMDTAGNQAVKASADTAASATSDMALAPSTSAQSADNPITDATDHDAPTVGKRGRRMRAETDRKILQACLQIAITQGIGAVSIEEVAKRSGVAKTTIYRRYRNSEDMLAQVQTLEFGRTPELAELSATHPNLQLMLERIVQHFSSQIGIEAVGIVLSTRNRYFSRIVEQAILPERRRFADFLHRGERAGVLRSELDAAFLFNTIIGSMIASQALPLQSTSMADTQWAKRMADLIWPAIAA